MTRSWRIAAIVLLAAGSLLVPTTASAHDPEHDHSGPGSTGPDLHSKNMKLLSNVPRSAPATQSDLAFDGKLAYAGNYLGFRVLDISDPENPTTITDFRCNGAQSDLSVWRGLLFQSVDAPQNHGGCDSTGAGVTAATPGMFEGIRIFDVSDPANPVHLKSVNTDCGSHTNTLVPDPANNRALIYISSYPLGNSAQGPNCRRAEDGGGHGFISIVDVPLDNPTAATVSKYFLDPGTEAATYPIQGTTFTFRACHDISVFTELKLAAAACLSESQLWDISDPANPQFLWRFDDPVVNTANIDLWHSSTFSWDGKVVAFGDESGGGGAARCTNPDDDQGRIWFLDTKTGEFLANYKIPRAEQGTCTMHNFNFVPLDKGRKVLVSAAYTGGTTVVDVDKLLTGASEADSEVGFYRPSGSNTWSSYWYNGFIYANDILRGVDIFLLSDRARAGARKLPYLNPQTQESVIR
ncbi:MAG: LVIVD repeat-containing protein [Haloechinothrix sp.]